MLLVYSDSTIWKEYFESDVIPRVRDKAIVLNWSQRKRWTPSLATLAFRRYGGRANFNPVAFVFVPFRPVKDFRYFEAFKDYKRGNPQSVREITDKLVDTLKSGSANAAA